MKAKAAIATAVLGLLAITGCSSGGNDVSASSDSKSTTSTTAKTTKATGSSTSELCTAFEQIVEQARAAKERSGGSVAVFTAEEWDAKLELTQQVVDAAPAEYHDAAIAYLDTVKLRKSWTESGEGGRPTNIDPSTNTKSQELLSYVKDTCNLQSAEGGGRPTGMNTDAATTDGGGTPDTAALCDLFGGIAQRATESGRRPGDPNLTFTAEEWEQKIATTGKLADAAPADYKEDAEIYLELVKARAELAAQFDYGTIPTDARNAFIADHADEQQRSNRFIQFMGSTCGEGRSA